ncbi:MAG: AAA family ATPase [Nitrospiraceae bacterium]|nr:AAA family ATPase [Nitrospiraceae bacterium]
MAFVIAFAGKGGTGKTSLAALTIKYLMEKRKGPVLGVDADSNNCLNEALGIEASATIGGLREDSLQAVRGGGPRPGGMSMEELFDYQVQQSIIESGGFDLMIMGRPEGPGCYCAANNIIRKYTDKLSDSYPYVVIDNEAGMEHLSRRTTHKVNILLVVSDPSKKGIHTASRINALVDELKLDIGRRALIVNRVPAGESGFKIESVPGHLDVAGAVPQDENIFRLDVAGEPMLNLPEDSPALTAFYRILDTLDIP